MTPKEKAKEIVNKFNYDNKHYLMPDAKKCALIAVDLRISAYTIIPDGAIAWAEKNESYWQEVKTEIEKL